MKVVSFLTILIYVLIHLISVHSEKIDSVFLRPCRNKYECNEEFGYTCGYNQTCHCARNYILKGDKCVGGIGQKCRYDEHCVEGAYCEFQLSCKCKDDMEPNDDYLACSRSKVRGTIQLHFYVLLYFLTKFLSVT